MAYFYEVLVADARHRGEEALTYSSDSDLPVGSVVSVPLRDRTVSGFIEAKTSQPKFKTKDIKNHLSATALPPHAIPFARWLSSYYAANLGDCLRQFAPSKPIVRSAVKPLKPELAGDLNLSLSATLTSDQQQALKAIAKTKTTTVLLHGETGSGKTRVYLELAAQTIAAGQSVIILTPEIALTSQLAAIVQDFLNCPVHVLHSALTDAARKKIWVAVLEAKEPVVVLGPRSVLFSPVQNLGLIVVDEAHEPAYKQEQSPRYQAVRAASQLGSITGAKVILGTATPTIADYYLADQHQAVVRMTELAIGQQFKDPDYQLVDIKKSVNTSTVPYFSQLLLDEMKKALSKQQQIMIYLNRRGSARVILCQNCGWKALCPNCDISLVYHADDHQAVCHTCGYHMTPPNNCPQCNYPEIVYKSAGTKAITAELERLFPKAKIKRFDSDTKPAEQINELYPELKSGQVDILVGTQILAKGLDLPKLGLVGVMAAESALSLPDFTAEERTFQLLYQVLGRIGRGHSQGTAVIQTYDPDSDVIKAAVKRDYAQFYQRVLKERQAFGFPPYVYLMQLICRRRTVQGAESAAVKLQQSLEAKGLPVEIIGPTPAFAARRGPYHFWRLIVKAKKRADLLKLAEAVPTDWTIDLDPADLL